jgi:hypothetical protein
MVPVAVQRDSKVWAVTWTVLQFPDGWAFTQRPITIHNSTITNLADGYWIRFIGQWFGLSVDNYPFITQNQYAKYIPAKRKPFIFSML